MVGGLVVVAVEQHQVVFGDQIAEHDLVGGRSAVEDEIGLLGAEDRRRLLLRLQRRPLVREQVAELEKRLARGLGDFGGAQEKPPE